MLVDIIKPVEDIMAVSSQDPFVAGHYVRLWGSWKCDRSRPGFAIMATLSEVYLATQ